MIGNRLFILLFSFILFCRPAYSSVNMVPDSLGLPGDNFNLGSTLDIFQKCETLEEFEKQINSAELKLNNLDLNKDEKIDYIRVTDHMQGTAHAIVLQVAINEKESQDVAVIEVEKDKNGEIIMQIIGNSELYGKDYILEPTVAEESKKKTSTPNPGYTGKTTTDTVLTGDGKNVTIINNTTNNYNTTAPTAATTPTPAAQSAPASGSSVSPATVVVALALLPIMGLLFAPAYIAYSSPYYYGYYPPYWSPWPPVYYHAYYAMHPPVYVHCHATVVYRAPSAHAYYAPHRSTSVVVVNNNKSGNYNNSYNRSSNNNPSTLPANGKPNNRPSDNKPSTLPANANNKAAANDKAVNAPKTSDNKAGSPGSGSPKPQTDRPSQQGASPNNPSPAQSKSMPSHSNPSPSSKPQPSQHTSPRMQSRPSGGGGGGRRR